MENVWRIWRHLNIWEGWLRKEMTTVRQWNTTYRRREELGADVDDYEPWRGGPKDIGALFQGGSTWCVAFEGRDLGPDPPGEAGSVLFFPPGGAPSPRAAPTVAGGGGAGTILHWRWQWRNRASRRSGSTSRGYRIWLQNILQRDQLWTSMNGLCRGRGCGWFSGCWSSKVWIWSGLRKKHRRSRIEMRERCRKKRRAGNEGGAY